MMVIQNDVLSWFLIINRNIGIPVCLFYKPVVSGPREGEAAAAAAAAATAPIVPLYNGTGPAACPLRSPLTSSSGGGGGGGGGSIIIVYN